MSDTGRASRANDFRENDAFLEAQEGSYEPEPVIHDSEDFPIEDQQEENRIVPDVDRPVALEPDDTEIA